MRFLCAILVLSAAGVAVAGDPVNIILGSRATDKEGVEVVGWRLHIVLVSDINPTTREATPSVTITPGEDLRLNGVKYDAAKAHKNCEGEPHRELLAWYAMNEPVEVVYPVGGGIDLVPMKGQKKADWLKARGYEVGDPRLLASKYKNPTMAEVRKIWDEAVSQPAPESESKPSGWAVRKVGG
jgi:hypothetical protein